jgi:uncharacterized lipoprotein NlpE involved in copper resistance
MSKSIFAILLVTAIGVLHYCKTHSKGTENIAQLPGHSSQNSLDWDGIYQGVLPCADCQGIQTTIYLNKNLSYRVTTKYLGRSDSLYDHTGVFSWNNQGNTITLHDQPKPNSYFVGEGMLTQLDMNGGRISGSLAARYILNKQQYAVVE